MARPKERGFLFIPLDVDIHTDPKIRRLIRRCGGGATDVYTALLCLIFRDGYYIKNEEDLAFILSERTGFDEDHVVKVLHALLDVGLIDNGLYANGIITSTGIQKRWQFTIAQLKRTARINEFALVPVDDPIIKNSSNPSIPKNSSKVSSEGMGVSSESTGVSSFLGKPYKGKGKKEIEERNKISSSYNSSSFTLSPEASSDQEKEKKEIIYYFTFKRNFMQPCAEYEKLVRFNSNGCPWCDIAPGAKQDAVSRWKQIPERKPRFAKNVLKKWEVVLDKILSLDPPEDVILDALSDTLSFSSGWDDHLIIYCNANLRDFIENNIPVLKQSCMALAKQFGCDRIAYKSI